MLAMSCVRDEREGVFLSSVADDVQGCRYARYLA